MGANRFMKPQKADYFQTYVSQYVPQPFELMQRAVDRVQAQYDAIEQNVLNSQSALLQLSAHSGIDTEAMSAITSQYSDMLNDALDDPDLNEAEKRVYTISKQIGKDPTIKTLLYGAQKEQDYMAAVRDPSKAKNFSSASQEAMKHLHDQGVRYGSFTNEGALSQQALATTVNNPFSDKDRQDLIDESASRVKDRGIETIVSQEGEGITNRLAGLFGGRQQMHDYFVAQENKGGISYTRANQVLMNDVLSNPAAVEDARYQAANNLYRTGQYEKYTDALADVTGRDVADVVSGWIAGPAQAIAGTDIDYSLHKLPSFVEGGGGGYDPKIDYTFFDSTASSVTVDPEKLQTDISATTESKKTLEKELFELTSKLNPTDSDVVRISDLKQQQRRLDNQVRSQKQTLQGMATKAGYDWDKEYKNFLVSNYLNEQNRGGEFITEVTDAQKKEIYESPAYSLNEFKDMVSSGARLDKTMEGVNPNEKVYQDRNVTYNMLAPYVQAFNEKTEDPKAKNYAIENVLMKGGSKTLLRQAEADLAELMKSGAAVELVDANTANQFEYNSWADEISLDRSKPINVFLQSSMSDGKPTFQITGTKKNGEKASKVVKLDNTSSALGASVKQIGFNMMDTAQGEPSKRKQTATQGAYIYGSMYYPELGQVSINTLKADDTYKHETPQGDVIEITPRNLKGGVRKYEVTKNGKPVLEQNSKAVVYNKPEDIFAALGYSLYLKQKNTK